MRNFGQKLKDLRAEFGMTPEELAEKLNMTKSLIWSYELNKKEPSYPHLVRIADYFDVTVDYLLNRKPVYLEIDNSLEEIYSQFNLSIDGIPLTKDEIADGISFIRAKRMMNILVEAK